MCTQVRDLLLNKIQFSGDMAEDSDDLGLAEEATPTDKEEEGMLCLVLAVTYASTIFTHLF